MGTVDPTGNNEGVLCLVKYLLDNDNQNHDLRIQIYKMGGDDEDEGSIRNFGYAGAMAAVALLAMIY